MQNKYKKLTAIVILSCFGICVLLASLIYTFDPCNIYNVRHQVQLCEDRYMNAGFIHHYLYRQQGFDSIIVDSSMSQNFVSAEIEKALGFSKVLPLYISGYAAGEADKTLRFALASGHIQNVVWGIDWQVYTGQPFFKADAVFPSALYDRLILNDVSYLLSYTMLKKIIKGESKAAAIDLQHPYYWGRDVFTLQQAIDLNQPKNLAELQSRVVPLTQPDIPQTGINSIVDLIAAYPQVHFTLFFPPYPLMSMGKYADYTVLKQQLAINLAGKNNVRLFDFSDVFTITGNLANYKDKGHYMSHINQAMLRSMARGDQALNANNVQAKTEKVKKYLSTYKVYSDYEKILDASQIIYQARQKTASVKDGFDLTLPPLSLPDKLMILTLDVNVPNDGALTLAAWEKDSLHHPLKKGVNKIYIPLEFAKGDHTLKLSFVAGSGVYTLRDLKIVLAKTTF